MLGRWVAIGKAVDVVAGICVAAATGPATVVAAVDIVVVARIVVAVAIAAHCRPAVEQNLTPHLIYCCA